MNKILFTFILILSCDILLSQEEHPNYFPLAVGNKWEYIINPSYRDRLVMTITKDTVMDNDKKYYIFEYNVPATNSMFNYTKYLFTPLDPVRMDENGDIYAYDNSTHNEYLYLRFSESGCYQTYLENRWICLESYGYMMRINQEFFYLNNVGMISWYDGLVDCWQPYPWDPPCPPFFNQRIF